MFSVLYDWPDDICERILAIVEGVMERGYSKLLINEDVIPDVKAHWEAIASDIMMLTLFALKERTRAKWKCLLQNYAGLDIVEIWEYWKWYRKVRSSANCPSLSTGRVVHTAMFRLCHYCNNDEFSSALRRR